MSQTPDNCPEHVWASIGVTVIDDRANRIWSCERCSGWTNEPLKEEHRVHWNDTDISN